MREPTVVLLHGAATTSRVWRGVLSRLDGLEVFTPDRRSTGNLITEIDDVAGLCAGAVVAGVSGGATLGLALLAAGVPVAGAVLHEPAVGSLAPGLLEPLAAAYAAGGVPAFGQALYGASWTPGEGPEDDARVARDLAMFRGFEPAAVADVTNVVVTVGEHSPPLRHLAARRLLEEFALPVQVIPGASHAVHLDHPGAFADVILQAVRRAGGST